MIVAIDGPAGSGKSSTAKGVASALGFLYLDTGAMYRAVTLELLKLSIQLTDLDKVKNFLNKISFSFDNNGSKIKINGKDISKEIRNDYVTSNVSQVSSLKIVRKKMVLLQKKIVKNNNSIVEGRDIGTTVFPNADLKFYLEADLKERAIRRKNQNLKYGINKDINSIILELSNRDKMDSSRINSPLSKARDAIVVDTSNLTLKNQISLICNYVNNLN